MSSNQSPYLSFVIPFRSRDSTGSEESWKRVSSLLRGTVCNLLGQTSHEFSIHVVGDDFPDGGLPDDDKLFFHPREFQHYISNNKSGKNRDRRMRVVQGCIHAGSLNPRFIMPVDADDRISTKLVDWLKVQDYSPAWTIERGHVLDFGTRRSILCDKYSHLTGSSCILSADETGISADLSFGEMEKCYWFLGGHQRFKVDMQQRGVSCKPIDFPAGCYLTGYGENLSNVFRSSLIRKIRRWLRFRLTGRAFDANLVEDFGDFNL